MKIKIKEFIKEYLGIAILVLVAFVLRLWMIDYLGIGYNLASDDMSYIKSGITFYETGSITMHGVLSAQIMPGMPVLIAIFVHFFGSGEALMPALKIFWIIMGSLVPFFVYKALRIHTTRLISLIPCLFFLTPDFVWQDQIILTETPFMLGLVILIYATFKLGEGGGYGYFFLGVFGYFLAFMMKANIGIYPVFAAIYLLLKKYPLRRVFTQGVLVLGLLLAIIIPWSARNYKVFDAFVPLTYGAGNPALLGTYQGYNYPDDVDLNIIEHVDIETMRVYGDYFNEDGSIDPHLKRYVKLGRDGILADYRKAVWYETDKEAMVDSYFNLKAKDMAFEMSFLWEPSLEEYKDFTIRMRKVDIPIIVVGLVFAIISGVYFEEFSFLLMTYGFNILLYAMTYSFDRYSQTLMPFRYICFGLGLGLIYKAISYVIRRLKHA